MRWPRPFAHGTRARSELKRLAPFAVPVIDAVRTGRKRIAFAREYTPDRHVIRDVIFPALREREDLRRLLFVGTAFYTRDYPRLFADREFWTIDIDPHEARYGAPGRHIVGSVVDVANHFEPESFDAVLPVGVFGAGVDTKEDTEAAINGLIDILRPGGLLILSWNDVDGRRPYPLDRVEALQRVEPFALPPFPSPTYPTFSDLQVWFAFYRRPQRVSP